MSGSLLVSAAAGTSSSLPWFESPMRWSRLGSLLLLLLAVLVFVIRGPLRMMHAEFNDLSSPYVSSRLWIHGSDPYEHSLFMQEWTRAGGAWFVDRGSSTTTRPAYPPPTLPVLAPLAILPWNYARVVFALLASSLYGAIVWKLRRASLLTLAIVIAMSSVGTAIGGGNVAIIAIELAVLGTLAVAPVPSGLLIGLSICIKPQLAIWLLLYYLLTRRWRIAATAIATISCSCLLAILRLPSTWFHSYTTNLSHFLSIGGVNDFTDGNPSRFELVNLQVIAYSATHDYSLSNLIAWIVSGTLLAIWAVWCFRKDSGLLALGTVALIGLLPLYQRFYNLPIVLILIAWAVENDNVLLQRMFAPLVIPWSAILQRLSDDRLMTGPIYNRHWIVQVAALPLTTWLLLAIVAIALFEMRRTLPERSAPVNLFKFKRAGKVAFGPASASD
jgi:hypothetical protein